MTRYLVKSTVTVIGALLVGCGALPGAMPQAAATAAHADRGKSWMLPGVKANKSALLYLSDYGANAVYVLDYRTGEQVGELTGLDKPEAGCVDAAGDVYIANDGNGSFVEYAHGGTKPIRTFETDGYATGCSVDRKNDFAGFDWATFDDTGIAPGEVCIWKGGKGKANCYSNADYCYYMWGAGYDDKGNLIIASQDYTGTTMCAVLAGSSKLTTVQFEGDPPLYPGGVMWDGEYITLTYQFLDSSTETGIVRATLSGYTLKVQGETYVTADSCVSGPFDVVAPFIVGARNTPVNRVQGKVVIGGNQAYCKNSDNGLDFWRYPAGGDPYKSDSVDFFPSGQVVSLPK